VHYFQSAKKIKNYLARRYKNTLFFIVSCLLYSHAEAVIAEDEDPIETVKVAYANILGSGLYSIGDRKAFVLNMPFEFGLYEPENADWSLNMLLPVTIGVLDTGSDDILDLLDKDQLQTLGVTPGVKMYIPFQDHWVIKPFIQAGYIYDIDDIHDAWIVMGGVGGLGQYQLGNYTVGLGANISALEQKPVHIGENSGIGIAELGLDVRHPLNMLFQDKPLEISIYTIASRYYNRLDLLEIKDDEFRIEQTYTIGMTLGTTTPFRLLGINFQRVGMGYKFGDGLKSITFNLGFPF